MQLLLSTVLLTAFSLVQADDSVRSAAYKAGDEQSRILSFSGSVIAEMDALLDEMSRNGISGDTEAILQGARTELTGTRDGAVTAAVAQLREISNSGRSDAIRNVVQQQQAAEIALRQIAAKIAQNQFTEEISALASAILARQDRALNQRSNGNNEARIAAEQQAIALQVQDLGQALASAPTDLPVPMAEILEQASSKAASLGLIPKADAAARPGPGMKARQKALRDVLAQVDSALSGLIPAKNRLMKAAEEVAKMREEQRKLAASQQRDPARSEALAARAEATARLIASECPAAEKALERASEALQEESQPQAAKSLADAAAALKNHLDLEKSAEQTSLAQAAEDLTRMAAEASALAAECAAPQPPEAASREARACRAESLQCRSCPLAREAAACIAEARKSMNCGACSAAKAGFEEAAKMLASLAAAARGAAAEAACLGAMQTAINEAEEVNEASGECLNPGSTGEVAGKLLKNHARSAQLAAQAANMAGESSRAGRKSAPALSAAAKAMAQAAASSLGSAQSAARGKLADSRQANAQASKTLAAAREALAQHQNLLRNQVGLPMPQNVSTGSDDDTGEALGKANGEPPAGDATGYSGEPQKGFSPAERQAMSDLRQTPVPPEYSGTVRSYFEQLAE